MECPKCGFDQPDGQTECIRCGLVFRKFEALQRRKDQINQQYSPVAATTPSPDPPPPPVEPSAAEATDENPPAPPLLDLADRLQLGIHSVLQYQESLFLDLTRQQELLAELRTDLTGLGNRLDTQLLELRGRLEPTAHLAERLAATLAQPDPLGELRQDIDRLTHQLRATAGNQTALTRLEARLNELEAARRHPPEPAPEAVTSPDLLLMHSEIQALRSEVRHLLEAPAPIAAPAATTEHPGWAALEARVDETLRQIDGQIREAAEFRSAQGTRLQRLENRLAELDALAGAVNEVSATVESARLEQAAFASSLASLRNEWRESHQAEVDRLDTRVAGLEAQRAAVERLQGVMDRLRAALTDPT